LLPWQYGEPVYAFVPQSEDELHSMLTQEPPEHVCPEAQVCLSLASVELEHFAKAVPGFEHVYVI
jgi:hypothetical protein